MSSEEHSVQSQTLHSVYVDCTNNRGNPIVALMSLLIAAILFGAFIAWYRYDIAHEEVSSHFVVFVWTFVLAVEWLLLIRAYVERPRRQ